MASFFTFLGIQPLLGLHPLFRRVLLIAVDSVVLPFSVWLCFWISLARLDYVNFTVNGNWVLTAVILIGIPLYAFTGR